MRAARGRRCPLSLRPTPTEPVVEPIGDARVPQKATTSRDPSAAIRNGAARRDTRRIAPDGPQRVPACGPGHTKRVTTPTSDTERPRPARRLQLPWWLSVPVALLLVLVLVVLAGRFSLLPGFDDVFGEETKDRSGPALLKSIKDMNRYEGAAGNFQIVVDLEKDAKFLPDAIRGTRTLYVGAGSVSAYVDLGAIGQKSVTVDKDRTAGAPRPPRRSVLRQPRQRTCGEPARGTAHRRGGEGQRAHRARGEEHHLHAGGSAALPRIPAGDRRVRMTAVGGALESRRSTPLRCCEQRSTEQDTASPPPATPSNTCHWCLSVS